MISSVFLRRLLFTNTASFSTPHTYSLRLLSMLLVALCAACSPSNAPEATPEPTYSLTAKNISANNLAMTETYRYQLRGLNFSPYVSGLDPRDGIDISESQLRAGMEIVKGHTEWLRTFGMTRGLEKTGKIAHELGFKVALGAWLDHDLQTNRQEIHKLIRAANAGEADMVIVGGEVLLRGDLSEDQLIRYIKRVRNSIPAEIPVAYADVHDKLLNHPNLLEQVDIILANYYPYWEDISIDQAIASLHEWHAQLKNAAGDIPVMVGETGWPSAGGDFNVAITSSENASRYFLNFVSWAEANDIDYFYFEAFDEQWKENYPGSPNSHWGIWDGFGNLKFGMDAVFNGERLADNWSDANVPGGAAGEPAIAFTSVPVLGSFEDLFGQVLHVQPDQYHVAVYIYVGGWWTKPTFDNRSIQINTDGSWSADITTGGIDEQATEIAAYLIPVEYWPPASAGEQSLPAELEVNSVARTSVTR